MTLKHLAQEENFQLVRSRLRVVRLYRIPSLIVIECGCPTRCPFWKIYFEYMTDGCRFVLGPERMVFVVVSGNAGNSATPEMEIERRDLLTHLSGLSVLNCKIRKVIDQGDVECHHQDAPSTPR